MKKSLKYLSILSLLSITSCSDIIELNSESNIIVDNYFTNYSELQNGLTACYNGMQSPLTEEWSLTELRSDNTLMDGATSTSTLNHDLAFLDQFYPAATHQGLYKYWLKTYNNIKNTNTILNVAGANFNPSPGVIEYTAVTINATAYQCKSIAAEASFIRAYHYFNLVRLYGGVFLIDEPVTAQQAKTINRSSIGDIYKLIVADLNNAIANGKTTRFVANSLDAGHTDVWAARALLAKVYLTLGRKAEAATLLNSIIASSGYSLQPSYESVFSINNEMNSEILFAIRFKGGGLGLGNPLSNLFAPTNSGLAVINGDGKGYNTPALELSVSNSAYTNYIDPSALRKGVNIGLYGTKTYYIKKYISPTALANDAENDWPVIRYADVLLMKAEADGNIPTSLDQINLVRSRSGLVAIASAAVATPALFEKALASERRWEFAFENQRWFDIIRFSTTTTSMSSTTDVFPNLKLQGAEYVMKKHFTNMFSKIYSGFSVLPISLSELQTQSNENRFLLPIPQYEIDTNSFITIPQNPGY
ncbi:MAG: RagB/SusD family nutrient uptake outer membrane protein [Flavobacteriaceae bacterium]|nr:RagB/SusD family nutrient uptake outer membrane protein [Flavobacteriaceae bacterium]